MRRLLCRLLGHQWRMFRYAAGPAHQNPHLRCARCGLAAAEHFAARYPAPAPRPERAP